MSRSKAADEMFCRSCGDLIKQAAEICPECGVRNSRAPSASSSTRSTGRSTRSASRSGTARTTTVSDTWYYGVGIGVATWVFVVGIAATGVESGVVDTIMGFLVLLGWPLIPIAIYYDSKYVQANSDWNPNTAIWCLASAIWFVNILVGLLYLYRRHETVGVP